MDLPRRSVRSGVAVMVAQAITLAMGIASIAALGRLLTPADFGVVAIATSFVAFVKMFADHGLPQSIVQRENITDAQINSLFWINVAGGFVAAGLGTLIAWPISIWFARPELFWIIAALANTLILTGLGAPHAAMLRRQIRFRTFSTIGVVANAVGVATGILAAIAGWSYWSLVAMTVAMTTTRTVGAWACSGWRPSRPALASGIAPMVRMGAYLSATSLVTTLARSADRILIGYGIGSAAAGFYSNASRLILAPTNQINAPLTSVAIPILSRLQNEPARFRAFYRRGIEAVVFSLCPFVLVAMIAAHHLVPLLLGPQWSDSVPIFIALTPAALVACTRVVTSWVYVPLGRTDRQFRWRILASTIMLTAYLVGIRWGAVGVAVAFSTQAALVRGPAVLYCIRDTFVTLQDILGSIWRIGVAVAVTIVGGSLAASAIPADVGHFAACLLIAIAVFTIYVAAFALTPGGPRRLRSMIEVVRHLRPSPSTDAS